MPVKVKWLSSDQWSVSMFLPIYDRKDVFKRNELRTVHLVEQPSTYIMPRKWVNIKRFSCVYRFVNLLIYSSNIVSENSILKSHGFLASLIATKTASTTMLYFFKKHFYYTFSEYRSHILLSAEANRLEHDGH